jgi:apolipoprotein N-acyltransferase
MRKVLPILKFYAPVMVTGLILGLCLPPFESSYFVFFLLIPLIYSLERSPEKAPSTSFVFGLFMSFTSVFWIFYNAGADQLWVRIISGIGMFAVNATFYAIFGLLYKFSHRIFKEKAAWTIPVLWGGMEHLMLFEELAFPWTFLAHFFTGKTAFIQAAEIGGVILVSMLIMTISVLVYQSVSFFLKKDYFRTYTRIQAALLIFFGLLIFGNIRLGQVSEEMNGMRNIKAALVHPGLDIEYKWKPENFESIVSRQMSLSESSLKDEPDMIIWGESNFPRYMENNPGYMRDFMLFAYNKEADLCIGSLGYDYFEESESFKKYNSAFFFDQNNQVIRYDKRKLVPFGESFPFAWILTFLKEISLGQANFDKGTTYEPFEMTNGIKFHPNICYEALFPYYNASFVRKGSEFIVNVSNDGWYEGTKQVYQHSRFNVFRAIENRRSIVRLANKAESSIFYPTGEQVILFMGTENIQKVAKIPLNSTLTIFTKYGYLFAYTIIGLNAALLLAGIIAKSNNRKRLK